MGRAARANALRADENGAIAIMTVLVIGVVFAMAALTIDVSRFYLARRQQQMVTDLAAVAAASNLGNAQAAALASLAANGAPASTLLSVELGTYTANPSVAASQRFIVGSPGAPNAARVTLQAHPSTFFGAALGPVAAAAPAITTRSIAANGNTADFALGSTLASFDGGVANAILGALTNSQISLSALDYQNLASARIDLFGLATALAARIGAGSVTLAALSKTPVRLSDLVAAAADAASAAGQSSASVAALRSIAASIMSSGKTVTLGALVDYAVYGNLQVGAPAPVTALLPALPLVTAAARLGGAGSGTIPVTLGATVPGLLAVTAKLAIGAMPTQVSYAGVGPTGTTVHTAQVRLLLSAQLAGLGVITGLNLPLYVEIAPAQGRIAALSCSAGNPVDPPVTLGITPGLVNGWIGAVSDASLADMTTEPNPGPAVLTNLGLLTIWGRAQASISNTSETLVRFSLSDIGSSQPKTTATTDFASSLLSQLFGSLQLSATILGLNTSLPAGATAAIGQILLAALVPLDTELSNTLAMLGLTLGDADSWVGGVRCGGGALVN